MLERRLHWRAASGHEVRLTTERLVSLSLRSLAAIDYEVEAVDRPMRVAIQSNLQCQPSRPPSARTTRARPRPRRRAASPPRRRPRHARGAGHQTKRAAGWRGGGHGPRPRARPATCAAHPVPRTTSGASRCRPGCEPGRPLRLVKFLAYHWSSQQSVDWLRDQVDASLESALAEGCRRASRGAARVRSTTTGQRADVRGRRGRRAPAGAALRAVPPLPGRRARNEGRAIPAKGLTGQRLRRPRLLGHRELRAARC